MRAHARGMLDAMVFALFLSLHLAYGGWMALILIRRMLAEGAVLGIPLVVTLLPVALVSVPVAALATRYAGPWFFAGIPLERYAVTIERFHLGVLLLVGAITVLTTLLGNFFTIVFISRERPRPAIVPLVVAGVLGLLVVLLGRGRLVDVEGRPLWLHPVGLLAFAVVVCLVAATVWARGKGGEPVVEAT